MKKKLIGIAFVLLAVISIKGCDFANAVRVNGVVTDIVKVDRNKGGQPTTEQPIVTFSYNGTVYETRHDQGVKFISFFEVGDPATVYFDSFDPAGAEVYSFIGYWFSFPTIGVALIICMAWIGICNISKYARY